jgi:hypothetical protein
MPGLIRTEAFWRSGGSPSAIIADPAFATAGVRANSAGTTLASGSFDPGDGSLLIPIVRHRITTATDVGHTAPTTTLSNMTTRTEAVTRGEVGAAAIKVSGWWTRATGATGSGTVTAQYAASVSNRMIEVIRFSGGFNTTTPIGLTASNRRNSGTSISVSFPSAPAESSIGILALIDNQNGVVGDDPAGWTQFVSPTSVGSMHVRTLWKRNPGQGPHTFTNLLTNTSAVILIEVFQA